jgi:hypothetical protein
VWRHVLHVHMGLSDIDCLPAPFSAGRSGMPLSAARCALFLVHYGLVLHLHGPGLSLRACPSNVIHYIAD